MSFLNRLSNRFSSSETESSASSSRGTARRREQVRRAQKTHRERKAEYVRGLEAEVSALRARDAHTTTELKRQSIINDRLRSLLATHNITLPHDIEHVEDLVLQTGIEVVGNAHGQHLLLHYPQASDSEGTISPRYDSSSPPHSIAPAQGIRPAQGIAPVTVTVNVPPLPSDATGQVDFLDPRLAIDFILALEQPCLTDFHNHPDPIEGLGHSMQLQSSIVDTAPAAKQFAYGGKNYFPSGATWSVPSVQLQRQVERLLITSQQLPLDGELTPVMCWMAVKDHRDSAKITRPKLERLKRELTPLVTCYGFGGVVDQDNFYDTLSIILQGREDDTRKINTNIVRR